MYWRSLLFRNAHPFLFVCSLIILLSCERQNLESSEESYNVLFFGNSFTEDAVSYVPLIINNLLPDLNLTIGIASIGACSLAQHYSNISGQTVSISGTLCKPRSYAYYYFDKQSAKWINNGEKGFEDILKQKNWDIITFQQSGESAAKEWNVYYEPYIHKIHKMLAEMTDSHFKLGWLLIHGAYSSKGEGNLNQWRGAMENTRIVMERTETELLFPYGTAIQNLRTTPLSELGDGKDLLADHGHLQEGIGCLAAAYSISLVIIQQLGLPNDAIIRETTRPSFAWEKRVGVINPNFGDSNTIIGITDNNSYLAQMAAIFSIENPFSITDCNYLY